MNRVKNFSLMSVLMLLLVACNRAPAVGKIGTPIDYKGYTLTVTNVEMADDFPGARKATAGNKLVAVELLIESNAGGGVLNKTSGVSFGRDHTRLVERNGSEHKAHSTGKQPILEDFNDLPKGESRRGLLTYEVPTNAGDLRFEKELPKAFDNVIVKVDLKK